MFSSSVLFDWPPPPQLSDSVPQVAASLWPSLTPFKMGKLEQSLSWCMCEAHIKKKFIETEMILSPLDTPTLFGAAFLILVFIMYLFHCQHSKMDEEETDEKHRVSVKSLKIDKQTKGPTRSSRPSSQIWQMCKFYLLIKLLTWRLVKLRLCDPSKHQYPRAQLLMTRWHSSIRVCFQFVKDEDTTGWMERISGAA